MFQSHQDPFKWASKRLGNSPVLVFSEGFVYLIIGTRILSSVEEGKIDEMVVAYLASYYLLDFEYPKQHVFGLSILHYFVFKDQEIPRDLLKNFEEAISLYEKYKSEDTF